MNATDDEIRRVKETLKAVAVLCWPPPLAPFEFEFSLRIYGESNGDPKVIAGRIRANRRRDYEEAMERDEKLDQLAREALKNWADQRKRPRDRSTFKRIMGKALEQGLVVSGDVWEELLDRIGDVDVYMEDNVLKALKDWRAKCQNTEALRVLVRVQAPRDISDVNALLKTMANDADTFRTIWNQCKPQYPTAVPANRTGLHT